VGGSAAGRSSRTTGSVPRLFCSAAAFLLGILPTYLTKARKKKTMSSHRPSTCASLSTTLMLAAQRRSASRTPAALLSPFATAQLTGVAQPEHIDSGRYAFAVAAGVVLRGRALSSASCLHRVACFGSALGFNGALKQTAYSAQGGAEAVLCARERCASSPCSQTTSRNRRRHQVTSAPPA